jgi:membrane protein DedA with SNARE-associated domain
MKVTLKKIIIPAILGFFIWIAAFFIIGWTQISQISEDPAIQSLYLPMVVLFGLGTFVVMTIFLWWYLPYLEIDLDHFWLQESLLCGIIIMLVQFILDIVTFGIFLPDVDLLVYFFGLFQGDPQGSTVIIMYPLIIVWIIIAGFIIFKKRS